MWPPAPKMSNPSPQTFHCVSVRLARLRLSGTPFDEFVMMSPSTRSIAPFLRTSLWSLNEPPRTPEMIGVMIGTVTSILTTTRAAGVGGELGGQRLRDPEGRHPARPGQRHREVRREVAVLRVRRALDLDRRSLDRGNVRQRAAGRRAPPRRLKFGARERSGTNAAGGCRSTGRTRAPVLDRGSWSHGTRPPGPMTAHPISRPSQYFGALPHHNRPARVVQLRVLRVGCH
jgi:hypothetical protein